MDDDDDGFFHFCLNDLTNLLLGEDDVNYVGDDVLDEDDVNGVGDDVLGEDDVDDVGDVNDLFYHY